MTTQTLTDTALVNESARKLIVTLERETYEAVRVRSCEVIARSFRNRTSFPRLMGLEEVFQPSAAAAIAECLLKLGEDTRVLSLPAFVLETGSLVLAGAHVISGSEATNSNHIIVRFGFLVGSLGDMFIEDIGFDSAVAEQSAHISAAVLADLALPLLNLCEAAEQDLQTGDERLSKFGKKLASRTSEIAFHMELLKRYLTHRSLAEARAISPSRRRLQ